MQGKSQCSTLGQTPATAFPVCSESTFFQTSVPTCSNGIVPVPCTDGVSYADANPFWYKFTCYQAGTLAFLIAPEEQADDYDWQLFDVTGKDPNSVFNDNSMYVAGNWSGNPGNTGASSSGDGSTNCAGFAYPTFNEMPQLIQGHNYILLVSHFSGNNQSGYDLSFSGGTATIADTVVPAMLSGKPNCSGEKIYIQLSKKMKCSSIVQDDFTISAPGVNIISASGANCNNAFDMDSVLLTLDKPLPAGNYIVTIQNGADGNTLLDNCGKPIPEETTISFTINPQVPTSMDSLAPLQCAPDELKLVFKNNMRCNSVASNGSDFIINGTTPVSIVGAAGDGCSSTGLSNIIKVKLSKPIQTDGSFMITVKPGLDGNTLIDECGLEVIAGSSINFNTKDTVSADFTYNVKLGCVYDTLFYSFNKRNGVTDWSWMFDADGTSKLENAYFLFTTYGRKHIKLDVTNGFCSDSFAVDILLDNELVSRFKVSPSIETCPEDSVSFADSSIGKIVSWYWTFGDGTTSTLQYPPPKYFPPPSTREGRIYPASLIVQNDIGCFDTARQNIKVFYNCNVAVPSAFTPNGDGLNDYLYPLDAYKADDLIFRVYNRWGQLVFETKNWTKKWDGRINGYPQDAGTYVWMLNYTNRDTGKKFALKGSTVLIR